MKLRGESGGMPARSGGGISGSGGSNVSPVYREIGTPVIKINSGGTTPRPAAAPKPPSFSKNKDMPNLIKIDSAKGNTVKKIAYRKRSSN
jgi:hypothetical protein